MTSGETPSVDKGEVARKTHRGLGFLAAQIPWLIAVGRRSFFEMVKQKASQMNGKDETIEVA